MKEMSLNNSRMQWPREEGRWKRSDINFKQSNNVWGSRTMSDRTRQSQVGGLCELEKLFWAGPDNIRLSRTMSD
jgi:hypothetical protein